MLRFFLSFILFFSATDGFSSIKGDNLIYFPVDRETTSEIGELDFSEIVYKISSLYMREAIQLERVFSINLEWENPYITAWASQEQNHYKINFWGGLARTPMMTTSTWEFIVCHEIGHILGEAPFHTTQTHKWASSEGQSDHFALNHCLPRYYKSFNVLDERGTPEDVAYCNLYHQNSDKLGRCLRILNAGRTFGELLVLLNVTQKIPNYSTPSPSTDSIIRNAYPSAQCRLDIFYKAARCLGQDCSKERNDCWYK